MSGINQQAIVFVVIFSTFAFVAHFFKVRIQRDLEEFKTAYEKKAHEPNSVEKSYLKGKIESASRRKLYLVCVKWLCILGASVWLFALMFQ